MSEDDMKQALDRASKRLEEAEDALSAARQELEKAIQSQLADEDAVFVARNRVAAAEGVVDGRQRVIDALRRM